MPHSLVLLNGPSPGASCVLKDESTSATIGRDESQTLPVDDHLCSRLHARVWNDDGRWMVEDCNSRNGTFLNSHPVTTAALEPGDVIRMGERLIVFVADPGDNDTVDAWQPRRLAHSTFLLRVADPERQDRLIDRLCARAEPPAAVRLSALCRLSEALYAETEILGAARAMHDALKRALEADVVNVWLVGSDGRLRVVEFDAREDAPRAGVHVLAGLSVENNEALLVQHTQDSNGSDGDVDTESYTGTALSAPIPRSVGSVESTRRGAVECLRSPARPAFVGDDLDLAIAAARLTGLAIANIEARARLEQANRRLHEKVTEESKIIGDSPPVRDLLDSIVKVSRTSSIVLLHGESGTGKELAARLIHDSSPRKDGPFVAVNCAAFNDSLLESELFGHEKGAFTGADARRAGQFERAHLGTLFLDEIGEMSSACQARVLRVLEGHSFERLGGGAAVLVDVRVVAATHRDLKSLVAAGGFREDLFFRLNVINVELPPLGERGDDVLTLAAGFLDRFRREIGFGPDRLSEAAADRLLAYHWPGNVRELKNAIERAVVLGTGEEVTPADLGLPGGEEPPGASDGDETLTLAEAELRHIRNVLDGVDGNKTQACRILGIGRGTLYKKLETTREEAESDGA